MHNAELIIEAAHCRYVPRWIACHKKDVVLLRSVSNELIAHSIRAHNPYAEMWHVSSSIVWCTLYILVSSHPVRNAALAAVVSSYSEEMLYIDIQSH